MLESGGVASVGTLHRYDAPPAFHCTLEDGCFDTAWVQPFGELDLLTCPQLRHSLEDASRNARLVVLDLRELTFMDSAGVHVILDILSVTRKNAGRLILVRGPAHVDRALTLTGPHKQIHVFDLDAIEFAAGAILRPDQSSAE